MEQNFSALEKGEHEEMSMPRPTTIISKTRSKFFSNVVDFTVVLMLFFARNGKGTIESLWKFLTNGPLKIRDDDLSRESIIETLNVLERHQFINGPFVDGLYKMPEPMRNLIMINLSDVEKKVLDYFDDDSEEQIFVNWRTITYKIGFLMDEGVGPNDSKYWDREIPLLPDRLGGVKLVEEETE